MGFFLYLYQSSVVKHFGSVNHRWNSHWVLILHIFNTGRQVNLKFGPSSGWHRTFHPSLPRFLSIFLEEHGATVQPCATWCPKKRDDLRCLCPDLDSGDGESCNATDEYVQRVGRVAWHSIFQQKLWWPKWWFSFLESMFSLKGDLFFYWCIDGITIHRPWIWTIKMGW